MDLYVCVNKDTTTRAQVRLSKTKDLISAGI